MRVKFYSGEEEKLNNKNIEDGAVYVTTDTNQVFADLDNNRIKLTNEADPLDTVTNEEFLNYITGDAGSVDNKNNDMFLFFNSNELEDLTIRTGFFYNAGAGWNTFTFPEPFEGKPIVICHCDGYNIEIKNVSETKFLYRLVKNVDSTLTNNTKTLYEYTGSSTSASYRYITNYKNGTQNTAFNVITGLDMSQEDSSVSDMVKIKYLAIANSGIKLKDSIVSYIDSTGEEYIDTGFHPNITTTRIETKFKILGNSTTTNAVYGCRPTNSSTSESFCIFYNLNKDNRLSLDILGSRVNTSESFATNSGDIVINTLNNSGTVNDKKYSSNTSKSNKTLDQNIYIFNVHNINSPFYGGLNSNTTGKEGIKMRLYYFKIYDNEVLVRDFVPYISKNGEVGLYDKINDKFYGNAGTGSFIAPE